MTVRELIAQLQQSPNLDARIRLVGVGHEDISDVEFKVDGYAESDAVSPDLFMFIASTHRLYWQEESKELQS